MNLFPYILGPVWVLDVTLTSDGHTIAAWRCKMGGEPQQTVYDAAAVAKGVAVVTVSGHGTIVKPADSQLAARVRDDRATFLWREHDGRIAFVRRERLQGMLTELSEAVPAQVVLTRLAVEPLTKRFEAGKPLQRQERTAVVAGTAPAAGDVSTFVERLARAACCRTVRLTNVERERDAERLVFRIEIGL